MTGVDQSSAALLAAVEVVGAPRRSLSSRAIRAAPLRPIPGGLDRVTRSSVATAARSWSTVSTARIAWAVRGPIPVTDWSTSKACRSSSSLNPKRVSESSRTTSAVATLAGAPGRSSARVRGPHMTESPTPPTSMTAWSASTEATVPWTKAITGTPRPAR